MVSWGEGGFQQGSTTISVVIPTCNRPQLVRRAIQSVLWQTHADLEVIVVDDASDDDTAAVISRIRDPRVRYVRQEARLGAAAARNTGIGHATGRYVAFLDDDDLWLPEKLEKQVSCFEAADDTLGAVHCGFLQWEAAPPFRSFVPAAPWTLVGDVRVKLLRSSGWTLPSALVVPARVIDEVGGFDSEFVTEEDTDLIMRIGARYRFGFVPEILAIYYDTRGSLMKDDAVVVEMRRRLLAKHSDAFAEHPDVYAQRLANVGYEYLPIGDVDRAKAMVEQALSVDPNNARAKAVGRWIRHQSLWQLAKRTRVLGRTLAGRLLAPAYNGDRTLRETQFRRFLSKGYAHPNA